VTEPEPHLGGRRLACPRGQVLGGSSSVNGMVYVRGHPHDFDAWAASGADGWGWADVMPYFKRMEHWHGPTRSDWRGDAGPLHVTRGPRANPLYDAFVEAGAQAGFETTPDYNGQKQEGFGPMEQTVWHGRRWSVANAYLRPAMRSGNVGVLRCLALRIEIRDGRATGVEIARGERRETVTARREVIVSASAINTPKLLMLSGIGPAAQLAEHGIPLVADRPGVGANLQDHLELYVQVRSRKPVTLYRHYNWPSRLMIGARWLFLKTGLGASNQFESAAFVRSRAGVEYPDIQFHFLPLAVRYDGKAAVRGHGFQAHVGPMRSRSRGTVRLAGPDPKAAPLIRFNYMAHEEDWRDFRRCIRLAREIFAQPAFAPYAGAEVAPGSEVRSDDEIDGFVREHVESAYHPCGTARLGRRDDPLAVVDPEARVIGVEGLRVADSSIIPEITNGNLNAPSIMVGEKVADHVLGRAPLPRSDGQPWINPRWPISDR
jgi:choline dehydrogenase